MEYMHGFPQIIHHDQPSHAILENNPNNQTSWDVTPLLGLMMPQITFWFSPDVEMMDGLESCNLTFFRHYHNIPM